MRKQLPESYYEDTVNLMVKATVDRSPSVLLRLVDELKSNLERESSRLVQTAMVLVLDAFQAIAAGLAEEEVLR